MTIEPPSTSVKIFGVALFAGFIFWYVRKIDKAIRSRLIEDYNAKGWEVNSIQWLGFSERGKYGFYLSPLSFISHPFQTFQSPTLPYIRKLEIADEQQNSRLIYVEIYVKGTSVVSMKELDSYDL